MDVIARLADCAGQAADAESAYTQVKMEDASKLLKIPKSECPEMWMRLPRHKTLQIQWFLLNENCTDTHLVVSCEKDSSKKFYWDLVHRQQGLFLSVYVDDTKLAGRKQNMAPRWKKLMNNVDLREPTSFLDQVLSYLTGWSS